MAWQDAIQHADGGSRLLLDVGPGARLAAFPDGHDPWRGRIRARVCAPARGGAANRELLMAVAAFFGVQGVRIEAGPADGRKTVFVPLERAEVARRLGPFLEKP